MKVKLEIPIHKESAKYISTLDTYKEIDEPIVNVNGRCIIHMYAKEDTNDGNGGGKGFCDAMNCLVYVYDITKNTVYKTKSYHDSILFEVPTESRIFKDLSTMYIIDGNVDIKYFQRIEVKKHLKC